TLGALGAPAVAGTAGGEPHPAPAPAASAEGGEDVLEAALAAAGSTGGEACAASDHLPDGVVLLALFLVGQHRVRLTDVLELLLGGGVTGVLVRVVLPRELAVGLLDLRRVGVGG